MTLKFQEIKSWKIKRLFYYLLYSLPKGNFPATNAFFSFQESKQFRNAAHLSWSRGTASARDTRPNPGGKRRLQRRARLFETRDLHQSNSSLFSKVSLDYLTPFFSPHSRTHPPLTQNNHGQTLCYVLELLCCTIQGPCFYSICMLVLGEKQ